MVWSRNEDGGEKNKRRVGLILILLRIKVTFSPMRCTNENMIAAEE